MKDQKDDVIKQSSVPHHIDNLPPWKKCPHEIVFEADTPAGKTFDVALLVAIALSVVVVMIESVDDISSEWRQRLVFAEWAFTGLFTLEYMVRLACVHKPLRYAGSFFGIVDLMSVVPTYLSLSVLFQGSQALLVIRTLRLIRVFRIFKLHQYVNETQALMHALRATRAKITVFVLLVMTAILILGSAMYLIEGNRPGSDFTSIPRSVYWAIVTMTTVGYGDIYPATPTGQALAAVAMVLGYSIIVVPTGIFSAEIIMSTKKEITTQACPSCTREGHDGDAIYCKYCSQPL